MVDPKFYLQFNLQEGVGFYRFLIFDVGAIYVFNTNMDIKMEKK